MSSAQRQPKVFKDLGKTKTVKITYTKEINSENIIRGKCYVGQNRGRQKSSLTFSNKQGVRDVQNQIEIQCKDCNKTLLAEISVEKGCCFQKCEILSPSGFTIASARKGLHWLSYRIEFQDVYYILKTRSQCPLLIDASFFHKYNIFILVFV
ncbi:uncharacterized protein [Mytilus edulis]|uniref:uncharacterized protein n=1 Tax=Mytilus edulis TaxID=6550 RepID=UPI0039F00A0F